jgi:hypothetical protein
MTGAHLSWDELLSVALVGTDRRSSTMDADQVLDAAAGWAVYRRAGIVPGAGAAATTPAGPETLLAVGEAAARRLAGLVGGDIGGIDSVTRGLLIDEWLTVAAGRGRLVPPGVLPDLLDYGRYHANLREPIAAVGGVRIQWLAGQNPDWRYLTAVTSTSDDPEVWSTGTAGQRAGYLRELRGREPDAARELLESEWGTLAPDERADLLAVLAERLGPADEALLEGALDDRRQSVRETAARLLARLPGTAYADRMTGRATAAVRLTGGVVTDVDLPAECDRAMRRDGIAAKPPTGVGERAWWLQEILARTPLATWPPELTVAEEWAATIYSGLARAAATQRDPVWAAAILDRLSGDDPRARSLAMSLYPVLAPDEVRRRAEATLTTGWSADWTPLLESCPAPWPEPLGRAALAGIASLVGRADMVGELHRLTRLAALRLPAELESTVELPDELDWILTFRRDMTKEIA